MYSEASDPTNNNQYNQTMKKTLFVFLTLFLLCTTVLLLRTHKASILILANNQYSERNTTQQDYTFRKPSDKIYLKNGLDYNPKKWTIALLKDGISLS